MSSDILNSFSVLNLFLVFSKCPVKGLFKFFACSNPNCTALYPSFFWVLIWVIVHGPDFNIVACFDSPSLKIVVDPIFFANILFIDIFHFYL